MERKNFLKSLLVGAASTSVLAQACSKDDASAAESSFTSGTSTSSSSGSSGGYSIASTETEGLFPTRAPRLICQERYPQRPVGVQANALTLISMKSLLENCRPATSNASTAAMPWPLTKYCLYKIKSVCKRRRIT